MKPSQSKGRENLIHSSGKNYPPESREGGKTKIINMKRKGFTLIELLVVIAI
ncbi:prepilin-type N-terminal cleavage/methylation domain-containing protein, partial [Candidatus Falkowbacteria bacterium]|nr:prepilin-type N-terminal cleavage/methylation domain-containing protein [Candidatus Falkowbacteria bacterium]